MKSLFQRLFSPRSADPHESPKVSLGTCGNYCISLESQPERLGDSRRQLSRHGIDVEWFPAILSTQVQEKITRKEPVATSADGCLQSHLELYRHILATQPAAQGSSRPYVAVFEDDIVPLDTFAKLGDYLAQVPDDWDFISLGGSFHQTPPVILDESVIRLTCAFNLHAQLIRVDFLPRLIKQLETRAFEVDVLTATMQQQGVGNWYGFTSDLVWQHARGGFFSVSLWEHQLGLYHFVKAHGVIDRFLIKNLLQRP
jgi:GR25 family glycosyltransferase involved in LPS biosynthesis